MRFHFTILAFALFYTYVVSYSINVDDLPAFFDDDDDDEVSRPELETFMERFGMDYGNAGYNSPNGFASQSRCCLFGLHGSWNVSRFTDSRV